MTDKTPSATPGERIAKVIARAGLASRREVEAWIAAGRVSVNGTLISSPALNVMPSDRITVDGTPLRARERTRLFLYHKPRGLMTTHSDPQGRDTIFRALPKGLPRLISVGRLDINTEGLLLLTNDGGLARILELPVTGWLRRYRVRAFGRVRQESLDRLREGLAIDGVRYGPIEATLDREQGANVWLTFGIREGKNREVRKVLETLGLRVNRLIRVAFGPFELGDLADGEVKEVETAELRTKLGEQIIADASADFDATHGLDEPDATTRHSAARPKAREPGIQKRTGHGSHAKAPSRNDNRRPRRRDRSGGPRPKHPRPH
jgi:23S rRNA pseudouridine2605 synthase